MFWFLFSGVYLFCVSHGQLEYFDDSDYDGLKLDLEPSSDMDYFSGVFGERQDPDGKFIYIFFFFVLQVCYLYTAVCFCFLDSHGCYLLCIVAYAFVQRYSFILVQW